MLHCLYPTDYVLSSRPPWKVPDPQPSDLDHAHRALIKDMNPNDPDLPTALTLIHNKFGQIKKEATKSFGLSRKERQSRRYEETEKVIWWINFLVSFEEIQPKVPVWIL